MDPLGQPKVLYLYIYCQGFPSLNIPSFLWSVIYRVSFVCSPAMSMVHLSSVSVIAHLFSCIFFSRDLVSIFANGVSSSTPAPYQLVSGDVAIDCGSLGNSTALDDDGREWIGDATFLLQPKGKTRSSHVVLELLIYANSVPYMTARISATEFHYSFQVSPGQKLIRLHFYPAPYRDFKNFEDIFTVKAGPFTLLRDFSASHAADVLGVKYLVKEFCLNVEENKGLNITFSPSQSQSSKLKLRNSYAFVNGIEIISMPSGLYHTPDGVLGVRIVGQNYRFYYIDNSTALEMVQRLNIGGSSISPIEDFGLFRRWSEDANYLLESTSRQISPFVRGIKQTKVPMPMFVAPLKIYQTSWRTRKVVRADEMHTWTWKVPVDLGFGYLIRLHFYEFELDQMTELGKREFNVLIDNQIADTKADVIRWSGGYGIPVYRDYMVMIKGNKEEISNYDLLISLQSADELIVGLINGLEIFKLSNPDNSLASPNTLLAKRASTSWTFEIQNFLLAFGQNSATILGLTILIVLLNVIIYKFKLNQISEEKSHSGKESLEASLSEPSCRCFTLADMISATQNFSHAFLIGKGGFGNVYKGFISGGSEIVAIKRLKTNIMDRAHDEFWAEIETLSKLRHNHLVSLIGYCNEEQEMILVYEYMPRGTLADNLYKIGKDGKDDIPLTWEQRLKICIGAARGLDYLHTGFEHGVIHRDVKDTNILLDENLVAKIADFGMLKLEKISDSHSYISTNVKGTFGYLDPDYFMNRKVTRKSDVYAFGIVLLVALCGRPAVYRRISEESQHILTRFRECLEEGEIKEIVDPSLQGQISSESLGEFLKTVENCVHQQRRKRPTMAQVVASLEYSLHLQLQQNKVSSIPDSEEATLAPVGGQNCEVGMETKPNLNAESITGGEDLQSRAEDYPWSSIKKPLWDWSWEALRKIGRPSKRKLELIAGDQPSTYFSFNELRAATDNLSHRRIIKNDEFWKVYKGFVKRLSMRCAIYQLKREVSDEEIQEFCNDIEMLSRLRHSNLLSLMGFCYDKNRVFIVYEYAGKSTLHNHLYDTNVYAPLTWNDRLRICIGIAQGLRYLHSTADSGKTRIHVDLRPENILLHREDWTPMLCHFGLSKLSPIRHLAKAKTSSTPVKASWLEYLPPEVFALQGLQSTEKLDLYSFGLVLLEVLCCRRPVVFVGNFEEDEKHIKSWVRRSIETRSLHQIIDPNLEGYIAETCLAELLKIAFTCLHDQPTERPSMGYVAETLKFALNLQETEDVMGYSGFSFESIYQQNWESH